MAVLKSTLNVEFIRCCLTINDIYYEIESHVKCGKLTVVKHDGKNHE